MISATKRCFLVKFFVGGRAVRQYLGRQSQNSRAKRLNTGRDFVVGCPHDRAHVERGYAPGPQTLTALIWQVGPPLVAQMARSNGAEMTAVVSNTSRNPLSTHGGPSGDSHVALPCYVLSRLVFKRQ